MSWVSGCRKMPSDCRSPMLRVSISEAPIRIGSVGRRICSRGMVVLPYVIFGRCRGAVQPIEKPSPVIARCNCDEAIQSFFVAPGLLRFARNDGAGVDDLMRGHQVL